MVPVMFSGFTWEIIHFFRPSYYFYNYCCILLLLEVRDQGREHTVCKEHSGETKPAE
jgi:hypothetical protein